MVRAAIAVLALLALAAPAAAQSTDASAVPRFDGKLYRSVFSSGPGMLKPADLQAVPEPLRARLARYLERRSRFKSGYKGQPDDISDVRSDAKRRVVERAIVSLVDDPGIARAAADFAAAAPIASEWEGKHDGPLAEATFAEDVLKKDPASPLAPWLYAFIAERQRIAFEAYENEKDQEGMKAAARKYRIFVQRARSVEDPIYAALVADMESLPHLYIKGSQHPRDFDPDT